MKMSRDKIQTKREPQADGSVTVTTCLNLTVQNNVIPGFQEEILQRIEKMHVRDVYRFLYEDIKEEVHKTYRTLAAPNLRREMDPITFSQIQNHLNRLLQLTTQP